MPPTTQPPTKGKISDIFLVSSCIKGKRAFYLTNNMFKILPTGPSTVPPSTQPPTKGKINDTSFSLGLNLIVVVLV